MHAVYGRDLDLNLLRVFAVVAQAGSVTRAADQLYLTQPAVSAALRRLSATVGTPLFAKQGRAIVLTARGKQLFVQTQRHLQALVDAALDPEHFDPKKTDRTLRIGLASDGEIWLLPQLLRQLRESAPNLRLIVIPIQFRTVEAALTSSQVSLAVTVADDLPNHIAREPLFHGGFSVLFDPRHCKLRGRITADQYFAQDHIIVSYNGDLRGVVEDVTQRQRRVRCSVASFAQIGDLIEHTDALATIPTPVAEELIRVHPALRTGPVPFDFGVVPVELLWPTALAEDEAVSFLRSEIRRVAAQRQAKTRKRKQ